MFFLPVILETDEMVILPQALASSGSALECGHLRQPPSQVCASPTVPLCAPVNPRSPSKNEHYSFMAHSSVSLMYVYICTTAEPSGMCGAPPAPVHAVSCVVVVKDFKRRSSTSNLHLLLASKYSHQILRNKYLGYK